MNLLKPWPFKIIVDQILPGRLKVFQFAIPPSFGGAIKTPVLDSVQAIGLLCLAMVIIQLLWSLLSFASNYMFVKIGLESLFRLRTELYAHLQRLSLKFHDTRRSTDSSFRVAYDSQSIQTIYNKGFTNIIGSGVTLIGTFAVMLRLDWQLTLLSLAIVPLLIGTIYFFAKRIRTQSTTIQEQDSALLTQTQEGLSSIRMVHAFGREDFEVSQFHEQAHGSLQANLRLTMTNVWSALVISTLIVIGTAAMYFVGSLHVLAGTLSLGVLLVFIAYLVMLYQPLESLTYTAWAMEGATAGARRCFEILDSRDDVGAGKSTLLSLVPRFYDPTAGRLTLDGRDIREITKKSLRQHIAIVLQDTLLFSTTVRENIAYGRPDATDEEIREAARRAQADEFISQLPNGYESEVGERGGHLSVGQRQRIGIARAFLKNAPILLLDEPTSALDPTTESAIMETIKDLMRGRTTIIITHRIATIHNVDQIVVLEGGRVVEQGRGPELVARGGVYAKLYASGKFNT